MKDTIQGATPEAPVDDSGDGNLGEIGAALESHMDSIPDNQKEFVLKYLTPELVAVLGIILGKEAVDYFMPVTDTSKMLTVVDRPKKSEGEGAVLPQPPAAPPRGGMPMGGISPSTPVSPLA